jgi:CRISPR/Cas system CSM-associated protein Csm2 small subunit
MEQTNVDRALAALEEQHADDPERVELLRRTRRFKSSWLQLGEALAEVKRGKTWERWGYESLEAYAKAELKLRMDTVEKLTGSYMFLHKSAPEVLRRDPLANHLPSYQAIDFLRRAEERNEQSIAEGGDHTVSEETMGEVRKKVLDEGVPMATVARLYKDSLFPVSESEKKTKDKKDIKAAATKLKELLAETQAVPRRLASTVGDALDELLNELAGDKKAA